MKDIDIEELYWEDWDQLAKDNEVLEKIFSYLKDFEARDIDELANMLKLYNNPSGAFTLEFANIIVTYIGIVNQNL